MISGVSVAISMKSMLILLESSQTSVVLQYSLRERVPVWGIREARSSKERR